MAKQPKEVNVGMHVRVNAYPQRSYGAAVTQVRRASDNSVVKCFVELFDGIRFWVAPEYLT